MKQLLIVLGIATAILLLMPVLVMIGYMALILPGLVLSAIPSLFFYLAAFAMIRAVLPLSPGIGRNVAAALATVSIGAAIPAPMYLQGRNALADAIRPEVIPATPVSLSGRIRVVDTGLLATGYTKGIGRFIACEAVCAALLETPGVTAVTMTGVDNNGEAMVPRSYRITDGDASAPEAVRPVRPEAIVGHLPRSTVSDAAVASTLRDEVVTAWGLRFAHGKRLIAETADGAPDQTITLRRGHEQGTHRLAILAVEVADRAGTPLLLRQRVRAAPLAIPLLLLPDPRRDFSFEPYRASLLHGGRNEFDPISVLLEHSNLHRPDGRGARIAARPDGPGAGLEALSERLSEAVVRDDDPNAAATLTMADPWFKQLDWRKVTPSQLELIARLIADPRINKMRSLYDGWERHVSVELRDAIAQRLSRPALPPEVQIKLNSLVAGMPPGTYAQSSPTEDAILRDPSLRREAAALVERQADRGAAAVPLLIDILQAVDWATSAPSPTALVNAICRALIRLGPDAADALPVVKSLAPQLIFYSQDRTRWYLARARMGELIEQIIPAISKDEKKTKVERMERDRAELRALLERENRERART